MTARGGAKAIFARSVAGVTPSSNITWFQAQQACENAGKRLLSNGEWQMAVAGTPDPGPDNGTIDCNTTSTTFTLPEDPVNTGSRSSCVSGHGAFDMVGNLFEWVADWVPRSTACGTWSAGVSPTGDTQCLAGAATTGEPGALLRGGVFFSGSFAGPLSVLGNNGPSFASTPSASVAPASHCWPLGRLPLGVARMGGHLFARPSRDADETFVPPAVI